MQKLFAVAVLVLASFVTVHYVFGADSSDRPPGVESRNWIPVADRLGFVIEPLPYPLSADRQALLVKQPLRGYFSAKTPAGWQRLAIDNPGEFTH
jgi:hypothetical protein